MEGINKIIHYCWFGGNPLPEDAVKCIESWKKYCPDYEIKQWDESNFDFTTCTYAREAYEEKKWAFVSDYARFWILYNYGGLYFDTDVELINDISDIVCAGAFMGSEPFASGSCRVAAGLGLGVEAMHPIYKEILEHYQSMHFKISDGVYNDETIVTYITDILKKHGYKGNGSVESIMNVKIYPPEYFCPMDVDTGELHITKNTRSIHWYSASWKDEREAQIHNRAVEIYKRHPNKIGKIESSLYEDLMKMAYYFRKEGLSNVVNRLIRKLKKNRGGY